MWVLTEVWPGRHPETYQNRDETDSLDDMKNMRGDGNSYSVLIDLPELFVAHRFSSPGNLWVIYTKEKP